ncbi:MAG: translocation/assembly module TamB domain-containing protein [Bacteriovorax sp.]|nr:translocation/assembly module TamB domain-containing protein [Rhizobacter sp.]
MAEQMPASAEPAAAPPTAPQGLVPRQRGRWWHALVGTAAALMTLLIALAAACGWAVGSARGSAWLLSALPGVEVSAPKGALLGDFEAQRVSIQLPGAGGRVVLEEAGWRSLRIAHAAAPRWCLITLDDLHARRVDVTLAPSTGSEALALPADLQLPVELDLRSLRVGELHLSTLGVVPLRDLQARVHLGANAGAEHRIEQLSLAWDRLRGSGTARIASAAPMTLDVAVSLAQDTPAAPAATATALPAWRAQATLAGPLAEPLLQATVRAQPSAHRPAQALDARAGVRPFARWPLGDVQLRTTALDLSAFSSAAPATALTGQADAKSTGLDQPARIAIRLANAMAGRWNEGRLPLRGLTLDVDGRPDQPGTLAFRTLDAELGTTLASAGRITGSGHWTRERWKLDATLLALQPAQLDARAPAMLLNGTLALGGGGLAGAAAAPDKIDVKASLAGTLTERGTARAVQLALDASLSPQHIELRDLQARAGGAHASATGTATHAAAAAPWVLKARLGLVDFDPAVWWPGRDDSAWRKGATRLNAQGTVGASVPASFAEQPVAELLNTVHGTAELVLADSLLVGVPVSGQGSLQRTAGGALVSALNVASAGNQIKLQGRLTAESHGADDAWDLRIDGPALDRLAPVFALFLPPGADTRIGGSLTASTHVTGRWPALTSTGQLDANALRLGSLSAQRAHARWHAGSTGNAPVDAELTLLQAASGANAPSVESMRLLLQGTGRAHTLSLRAESKALPPAWTEALGPAGTGASAAAASSTLAPAAAATAPPPGTTAARTVLAVQARGGLFDGPSAALAGWRGELQQIDLHGQPVGGEARPLLRTQSVGIEVQWAGGPARASVQPGRAEVLGGALRWSRIAWQAASGGGAGEHAQIDAEAELEPLRIAPILARLQPDFGWGGDLMIGGRVLLHSAPTFAADIVIERRSGDLTVTDELGTQGVGLTDLRLALTAQNGVWNFTQAVAGKALGAGAGAVVMRTSPQAVWPAPETPIEGVFELQVAHLATWGGWVPPGWRIDGALRTSASFGGRFGAPQYTGEIIGSQVSVRNFLQGVNVSDGDVAIRLQGTAAHIERFNAKAGSGSLRVEGDASFGETPQATVTLTAEHFQLLGRVDRRIVASGQAKLQFDARNVAVDGRFDVDEGLIDFSRSDAPELASDVEVRRAPSAAASAAAAAQRAAAQAPNLPANTRRNVAMDLRVGLGQQLRIRGHGLDTGLRGELRITSPGGRLAVNGTVQAADGTYAAYGQKLGIDRGVVVFNGEVGNPRLDIEATRPNLDLRVGVAVTGTASSPRIRLFSEPELSEMDKLSWLVMGRASDGLGSADTALLQRAALALLSGEGGGLTEQFTKAIGLDELSVRRSAGEVSDTVVSLGKQLSRRWYVGYERGLNATTGSWQLIYRVARRFTLRAQSGEDNSLDVIWTWRWQ